MIAIYPENEVAERRKYRAAGPQTSTTTRKAGRIARRLILGPLWSIPVERAIDALSDKAAGLDVRYATSREFKQANLTIPGHIKLRTLYVIHPKAPLHYLPAASFHRMAFEQKFAEAWRLLMALGATSLVVEHEHGWSREVVGKVDVPVPEEKATVGLTTKGNAGARSKVLFEASFTSSGSPSVPEDLIWYPHEPLWQAIAESRLKGGMNSFSLTLRYDDDFGVNADLIAKAEGAKIEIGGKFESHVETMWRIHGDFRKTRARKSA